MDMAIFEIAKKAPVRLAILAALFMAAIVPPEPAYSQDESITASCYEGNTDEGNYVGDISVNNPRNAGIDCNLTYEDCNGECLGCVIDSESNQVCYDNDGIRVR